MASTPNNPLDIQSIIEEAIRNELILKLIFENLPIKELKVFRLVCSKWNRLVIKEIQTKNWKDRAILFKPSIPGGGSSASHTRDHFEAHMNTFRDSPENLLYSCHQFGINLCSESDLVREFCIIFRKQIKGIHFLSATEAGPCAQEILDICGESLVELGITSSTSKYSAELNIKKSSGNRNLLPNLKCISVDFYPYDENDVTETVLSRNDGIFKNILSHMRPNALEELNYHNWGRFDSILEHLIEFNQIDNLQTLSLYPNSYVRKGSLLILKNKGINLRLKQLRIHITNPTTNKYGNWRSTVSDFDPEELYQFLVTQKNSLEDLNLICSNYSIPSNMMRVQKLKIGILREGLDLNTRMMNFAKSFPNIKKLHLWTVRIFVTDPEWDKDEQILSEQEPCITLRELTLPPPLTLSSAVITRTLRTFPKLSFLELYAFNSEVFLTLWNSVELADSLNVLILWIAGRVKGGPVYIKNSLHLDQIFSGVSEQEILSITLTKYSEEFNLNEFQKNSILKLKNLRKFHVYWLQKHLCQLHLLTDFVMVYVFNKMEKLRDLFIHQNIHRFSHGCIARLRTNLPNYYCEERLHNNSGRGETAEDYTRRTEGYLRTKMLKSELHLHLRA